MDKVTVRDLEEDVSRILRRVQVHGESFEVIHYGRVIAKIIPADDPDSKLRSFDEFLAEWDALTADDPEMPIGNYAVEAIRESRGRLE